MDNIQEELRKSEAQLEVLREKVKMAREDHILLVSKLKEFENE
jgi:hypothetical protein